MKKLLLILCAGLIFTACGAITGKNDVDEKTGGGTETAEMQVGDTVLFKVGPINYTEGKIDKIDGGKYEIRAGDAISKPDASEVYVLPKAGSKTEVKTGDIVVAFSYERYWEGGEVKNVADDLVEVEKATGGKLNVAQDKVIKVSPKGIADIKQNMETKAFEDTGKTKKPVLPKNWKPKAGEKVAAQWSFGSWHVAVIKHVNANNIDIDWQNGWSDSTIDKDKIAPYPTAANPMPNVDDDVIVKPQSDGESWKFAMVTTVSGQEAEVKFSDGKTQKIRSTDFIAIS
ncbi:MAG: hypothetical protein ACR2F2_09280 [Pyrinomonadaceae bacterium]